MRKKNTNWKEEYNNKNREYTQLKENYANTLLYFIPVVLIAIIGLWSIIASFDNIDIDNLGRFTCYQYNMTYEDAETNLIWNGDTNISNMKLIIICKDNNLTKINHFIYKE
jgi:hypothetical protein